MKLKILILFLLGISLIQTNSIAQDAIITPTGVPFVSGELTQFERFATNTINGSGMSDNPAVETSTHSQISTDHWLNDNKTTAEIIYDLGSNVDISEMLLWNYNEEGKTDRGANAINLQVSSDSDHSSAAWTDLGNVNATEGGTNSQTIALEATNVRLVRLVITSNHGGQYVGLAEVRFVPANFEPDTEAPSKPTGLLASNITNTSVTLTWTASTDNRRVSGYDVYQNDVLKTSTSGTSATISGLTASTNYNFKVVAKDPSGNTSESDVINVRTKTFATAPCVAEKVTLTGSMVTGGANALVDEQAVAGDPRNGVGEVPTTAWSPSSFPSSSHIDFGEEYYIEELHIYDHNNNGPFTISTGEPGSWTQLAVDNTTGYHSWNQHTADAVTQYLQFTAGASAVVNEVVIYGCPTFDGTAPETIDNLTILEAITTYVTLQWTAPGDDGGIGTSTSYDLRYSTAPINASNFDSATPVAGLPAPSSAGTTESFTVSGLSANTIYYFAIKAEDEAGNVSAISNIPSGTTLDITVHNLADYPGQATFYNINRVHGRAEQGQALNLQPGDIVYLPPTGSRLILNYFGTENLDDDPIYVYPAPGAGVQTVLTSYSGAGALEIIDARNVVIDGSVNEGVEHGIFIENYGWGVRVLGKGNSTGTPTDGRQWGAQKLELRNIKVGGRKHNGEMAIVPHFAFACFGIKQDNYGGFDPTLIYDDIKMIKCWAQGGASATAEQINTGEGYYIGNTDGSNPSPQHRITNFYMANSVSLFMGGDGIQTKRTDGIIEYCTFWELGCDPFDGLTHQRGFQTTNDDGSADNEESRFIVRNCIIGKSRSWNVFAKPHFANFENCYFYEPLMADQNNANYNSHVVAFDTWISNSKLAFINCSFKNPTPNGDAIIINGGFTGAISAIDCKQDGNLEWIRGGGTVTNCLSNQTIPDPGFVDVANYNITTAPGFDAGAYTQP